MSEYPAVLDDIIRTAEEGKTTAEQAQQKIIKVNGLIEEVVSLADEAIAALTTSGEQAGQSAITNLYAQEQTQIGLRLHNEANFSEQADARKAYQRLLHGHQVIQDEGTALQGLHSYITETAIETVRGQQSTFRDLKQTLVPAPGAMGAIISSHSLLVEKAKDYKERRKKETRTVNSAQNSLDQAHEVLKPTDAPPVIIQITQIEGESEGEMDIALPPDPLAEAVAVERRKLEPVPDQMQLVQTRIAGLSDRWQRLDNVLSQWQGTAPIPQELITLHLGLGQLLTALGMPPEGNGLLPVLPEAIDGSVTVLINSEMGFATARSQYNEGMRFMRRAKRLLSLAKMSLTKYLKR